MTGGGTLTNYNIGAPATFTISGDWSGFTGTLNYCNSASNFFIQSAAASNLSGAKLDFITGSSNTGNYAFAWNGAGNQTIQLGELSGSAGRLLNNINSTTATFQVGALNTTTTYGGVIANNFGSGSPVSALTKVGSGNADANRKQHLYRRDDTLVRLDLGGKQ